MINRRVKPQKIYNKHKVSGETFFKNKPAGEALIKRVTVAVALSGGVDSAYAAKILKDGGFKVFALTMQVSDSASLKKSKADIKRIVSDLNIEHFFIDLRNEFKSIIIDPFCSEYLFRPDS